MIELLAPAGNPDALAAAAENGADAVYLAGERFGARAYAENFSKDALAEAIKFAHLRNIAVHITVNTAVEESELPELANYFGFLYDAGADAVLLSDLGAAYLAKKVVPRLPIHASTQMTIHNLAGVLEMEELGFSRVVLSRELSLDEIKYIAENSKTEIEIFAHGALCVCYSGQCLMSSMIGGRSGNRGRCAQPCRLPYILSSEKNPDILHGKSGKFLLSPRDLNTISLIPELVKSGISSLKIEGRMKRPEYVAVVTGAYRRAIDMAVSGKIDDEALKIDEQNLAQVFNRDFTSSYLDGNPRRNLISDSRPNNRGVPVGRVVSFDPEKEIASVKLSEEIHKGDELDIWVKVGGRSIAKIQEMKNEYGEIVETGMKGETVFFPVSGFPHAKDRVFRVFDSKLMSSIRESLRVGGRKIPISFKMTAKTGENLKLHAEADGIKISVESDELLPRAEKHKTNQEFASRQLDRLGGTVYKIGKMDFEIEDGVIVPASMINDLRRKVTKSLDNARLERYARPNSRDYKFELPVESKSAENFKNVPLLLVNADSEEKAIAAIESGSDGIVFGGDSYSHREITKEEYKRASDMAKKRGKIFECDTPRILREKSSEKFLKLLDFIETIDVDAIRVHNIATLSLVKKRIEIPIVSDFSIITFNSLTTRYLRELGVSRAVVSPELNFDEIEALSQKTALPLECIVYGRAELMVSAYCAAGTFLGGEKICNAPCTRRRYELVDRTGAHFPIVTDAECNMHILNSKTLSMLPHLWRFSAIGVRSIRVDGRFFSAEEIRKIVGIHRKAMMLNENSPKELRRAIEIEEGENFTRGHYFRGVM